MKSGGQERRFTGLFRRVSPIKLKILSADFANYIAEDSRIPRKTETESNTEGVRHFQPRVELWQPWGKEVPVFHQTLKGFAYAANPFRVPQPSPT